MSRKPPVKDITLEVVWLLQRADWSVPELVSKINCCKHSAYRVVSRMHALGLVSPSRLDVSRGGRKPVVWSWVRPECA